MVNFGILGSGTVGAGVIELLNKNKEYIRRRTGLEVGISKILIKNLKKHYNDKYFEVMTDDIEEINNTELDIVVEAIGGLHPAYEYIKNFLIKRKHVITANKDVIAKFGEELSKLAEENGVSLRYEASVAGGIPILKSLQECLAGNDIQYIIAILNGTTNFILSKMYSEEAKYEDALQAAQQLGFAEANPDADVLGLDSARKLAILSSISYDERVNWEDINIEGITDVDEIDIRCAKNAGYTIKLLGISSREEDKIYAAVRPVLVPQNGILGKVDNEFNGIVLEGDAVGQMFFCGKGAGKLPTSSAVMGDIFDVLENKKQKSIFIDNKKADLIYYWKRKTKWLLRINSDNNEKVTRLLREKLYDNNTLEFSMVNEGFMFIIIESENEESIDTILSEIRKFSEIKSSKKLMILDI